MLASLQHYLEGGFATLTFIEGVEYLTLIGTGLGLSIVKSILELHGYEYGVISEKDNGSNFYFIIEKEKTFK